jgi:hypothetical protein
MIIDTSALFALLDQEPGALLREDVIPATGRIKAEIAQLLGYLPPTPLRYFARAQTDVSWTRPKL